MRTSFFVSTYKQSGFLRVKVTEMSPLCWGGVSLEKLGPSRDYLVSSMYDKGTTGLFSL